MWKKGTLTTLSLEMQCCPLWTFLGKLDIELYDPKVPVIDPPPKKKPTTVNVVRHTHPNVQSRAILFTVTKIWDLSVHRQMSG